MYVRSMTVSLLLLLLLLLQLLLLFMIALARLQAATQGANSCQPALDDVHLE